MVYSMSNYISLYEKISYYAEKNPAKCLISIDNNNLTFSDCIEKASKVASFLQSQGVKKSDKILIILPNSHEWYISFCAIISIGAIPVPLDPQVGEWELNSIQNCVSAKSIICCEKFRAVNHIQNIHNLNVKPAFTITTNEILQEDIDESVTFSQILQLESPVFNHDFNETLMLASTSGTTGNPKIIQVEQSGFLQSQSDMASYLDITASDIMLLGMPLYHQGGFGIGIQATLRGASLIYQEKFTPDEFLKSIEKERATIVQLTPTLAKILLSLPNFEEYDISSVRLAYFAGENLSNEIAREFWEKRGIRVLNVVGSTETGTMVAWDSDRDKHLKPHFLRTLPFTKVSIENSDGDICPLGVEGEIVIQTSAVLLSYWGNKDESDRKIVVDNNGDRWFKTGDLGSLIDRETIEYKGRIKRIVKRGANLIYPEELESFLVTNPQIKDTVICGEKDPLFGEKIVAYIVPQFQKLSRGDLLKFCRGKIASYKIPDIVINLDTIPINKGKVDFKRLKQIKELSSEIY